MGTKAKIGLLVALALVVVGVVVWDKMTIEKRRAEMAKLENEASSFQDEYATSSTSFQESTAPTFDSGAPTGIPASDSFVAGSGVGTPGGDPSLSTGGYSPIYPPSTTPPVTVTLGPSSPENPTGAMPGSPNLIPPPVMFPPPPAPEVNIDPEPVAEAPRVYEVQDGDSLWVISKREYGNGAFYSKIREANLDKLPSERSMLRKGMKLNIPSIETRRAAPPADDGSFEGQETYTVQSGDTFSSIASHFYGDAKYWKRIADANKDRVPNPGRMKIGMKIVVPPAPADESRLPVIEPGTGVDGNSYVVASGDSLAKIAVRFFENENAWKKIYEANRNQLKNEHTLRVGQVLVIPDASVESE